MQRIIDIKNGVTRMPEWRMAQPVDFELLDGENIAITGPNGGGKSMFVDIITGKHPLLGDCIKYDFAPSTKEYISDNIKYVCFKDTYGGDNDSTYYLQQRWNQTEIDPETATVGSRLEAAYQAAGDDTEERRHLQQHIYELFGLEPLLDKYVILLSSGELRKLVIASSIFSQPRLLIIDNPYIGLDKEAREQLTNLLQILSTEHGIQIMLVVNRTKDIPEFVSHVVEVSGMTVGRKMTRSEYMAQQQPDCAPANIPDNWRQMIEELPYKEEEYNAQRVVDMHKVCIRYGERTILKDLDWQVMNGEYWALTGRNGSGKSTLLSLVCADKSFLKLSSGEQRLVLLARAMVKDPELLILDEPLHGLDEPNRRHVKQVIEAFCQRKGKTLIMVTHYEDELPACINHKKILYKNK